MIDKIIKRFEGDIANTICEDATITSKHCLNLAITELKKAQETKECLEQAILVIEDFLPNIRNCVLQDYGRLNDVLLKSEKLLKD